ncbi:MAG TPA: urease accessory protein UreD [Chondromyces sp.]|nr:urease accessory protein UreD [Chondromyces sp.]
MNHTGVLELSAERKQQRTILSNCYYEGALKITRPVYLEEDIPCVYLIHVGGGYVDGDQYLTSLVVEEGAELIVTTQSSTKVYKTPKEPVIQRTNIQLGRGSVLEYLPDPLIAYEGARFVQETEIHMEEESCFFYSDIITPGWAEDGSFFRYDWIRSKVKVYKGEKLVLFDHTWLEPDGRMGGMMQMDGYTHMGTFLIVHHQIGKGFLNRLYEKLEESFSDSRFGVSALSEGGVIVRILAANTGILEKIIACAHRFARNELLQREGITWRKY